MAYRSQALPIKDEKVLNNKFGDTGLWLLDYQASKGMISITARPRKIVIIESLILQVFTRF
jgi:hypothetical protein